MQQVAAVDGLKCNGNGRVRPAEAARQLGIDKSALHRYLTQWPDLKGLDGRVNIGELRKHRADNPRVAVAAEREAPPPALAASTSVSSPSESRIGAKHRLEEIRAWEAERQWAESIGKLVDPESMIDAIAEAGVSLRDALMAPDPTYCERMAAETDPRAIAMLWREYSRSVLAQFTARMKVIAGNKADPGDDAGG